MTPLHFAARYGRSDLVGPFVATGALINKPNRSGRTPLDIAESYQQIETAEAIKQVGGKKAAELSPH
jgi:ankyrin repeat protein